VLKSSKFSEINEKKESISAPKIYLEEYEDLTSKLHQFETMERNLFSRIESLEVSCFN
jgi:hypothetical protein